MMSTTPNVAFLGVCERANKVQDGYVNVSKYNLMGLKKIVPIYFVPFRMKGLFFVFGIYCVGSFNYEVRVKSPTGKVLLNFKASTLPFKPAEERNTQIVDRTEIVPHDVGWTTVICESPEVYLMELGEYQLFTVTEDKEALIGKLLFIGVDAQPLSLERIAAIKGNPIAPKWIDMTMGCSKCDNFIKTYTAVEQLIDAEKQGFTWYQHLPDSFSCSCGKFKCDLKLLRKSMHAMLMRSPVESTTRSVSMTRMYEAQALQDIIGRFSLLLDSSSDREETIQKYIESNTILLSQFSLSRIFFKSAITTQYNDDFSIVTPKKELILIEIERPNLKLLKKDGGIHSELTHAFDQVENWLSAATHHRDAVIHSVGKGDLRNEEIGRIRGVVIAGRDKGQSAARLRDLKMINRHNVDFFTYDDLLNHLVELVRDISNL